jgi:hypothetical protein
LDAQAEILLAIRSAGGDILSLSEPQFGKTDFAGRIVTLVAQHANSEKSKTVKATSYRGMLMARDNKAHRGSVSAFWESQGAPYNKRAVCLDPKAVRDIYRRVANGESIGSVSRVHDIGVTSVKALANELDGLYAGPWSSPREPGP